MRTRILAVDDDPAILDVLQLMLEHLNCDVFAFTDSRQAAERVSQEEFHGIFLDAQMPHINGLELARLIRESAKNRSVPIVMLTGSQHGLDVASGSEGPITFFLEKPFDMLSLEHVLADITEQAGKAEKAALQTVRGTPD